MRNLKIREKIRLRMLQLMFECECRKQCIQSSPFLAHNVDVLSLLLLLLNVDIKFVLKIN